MLTSLTSVLMRSVRELHPAPISETISSKMEDTTYNSLMGRLISVNNGARRTAREQISRAGRATGRV
jgi:hypothetical protein